uniref:uncharacterized protein LOC109960513 n=1 Tax=Monopterus albus TaxID=43700 RepID=UPI0009B4199C|nr:uncharacterized protein LOC109960513 [Monopterus albus]
MVNRGFISLHFVFGLGVFQQGVTAVIQTQQTVLAAVGEEASLNCQLLETKDVVQVTWQKISPEKKNLATYSKYSGQWVNSDKIEFKETGLQSSAIIVRNVTQQDEGCYSCLFNTDPDGALIGRTCLQLYGVTAVIQTQQTVLAAVGEEAGLNCQLLETKDVVQVTWQKISPEKKNLATVLSAPQLEVFMMLPQVKQMSADGEKLFTDADVWSERGLITVTVILVCIAAVTTALHCCKLKNSVSHRDPEKNKTPQKTAKDTPEIKTLLEQKNEQMRLRTPAIKSPNSKSPVRSPLTGGCRRGLPFCDTE